MNDPLRILQAEHLQIGRRLDDVRRSTDREKAVAELQAAIVQHVEREASIVYPTADAAAVDAERLLALADALAKAGPQADVDAAINSLRSAIAEHSDTVEHHLLPSLHARLGETGYLAVGDALVRADQPDGVDAV